MAEMARGGSDAAAYMGLKHVDGQAVNRGAKKILESISAKRAGAGIPSVTSTAAETVKIAWQTTADEAQATTEARLARAESMGLGSFIKNLLWWMFSWLLPTSTPTISFSPSTPSPSHAVVCTAETLGFFSSWSCWFSAWHASLCAGTWLLFSRGALALVAGTFLYYIFQGLAFQLAFDQMQRGVWWENVEYGLGPFGRVWRSVRVLGVWLFCLPFRIVIGMFRFVWNGEELVDLLLSLREGRDAVREWCYGWYLHARYNWYFDELRRRRLGVMHWIDRNTFWMFAAVIVVGVALRLYAIGPGSNGDFERVVRFDSWRDMAAYYNVPQYMYPNEEGGAFNAQPWRQRGAAVEAED